MSNPKVVEINGKPKPSFTYNVPKSKLLINSQNFLSKFKESNNELNTKINNNGKESVLIEHSNENMDKTKPYIDMDIFMGILQNKKNDNENTTSNNIKANTDKLLGLNNKNKSNKKLIQEL